MKINISGVGRTLILAASFFAISCGGGGTSTVGPTVISVTPINNATLVPTNSLITATFNTPMAPDSLNAGSFTATAPSFETSFAKAASTSHKVAVPKANLVTLTGTITFAGHTATLKLDNLMPQNTVITITIGTGVKNLANQSLAEPYVWSFTTGTNDVPPTVVTTIPTAGAVGVSPSANVSATFNKGMNAGSFTATTFNVKAPNGLSVPGTISYTGNTVSFAPTTPLVGSTLYTATITNGVTDIAGTFMVNNFSWTFTTSNTDVAPTVTATIPAAGAIDVLINTSVSAAFSEPMNPSTINGTTFTLTGPSNHPNPGVVTYSNGVATLTPTSMLTAGMVYTATITTGAKDLSGTGLASTYSWTFLTETPPTVISTIPLANAQSVLASSPVIANFSKAMNPTSVTNTSFSVAGPNNVAVPATVSYSNGVATLVPTNAFAFGTKYTATITSDVKDVAGSSMVNPYTWSFTIDMPPSVVANFPANNQTQVGVGDSPTATFNEALNPLTVTNSTFTLTGPGNIVVPASVTYANKVATLTPTTNLAGSTLYTATVTTGVKSVAGTPMVNSFTWTFTTGQAMINLGTAGTYGVLAGSTITNTGPTIIKGDLGVSPGTAVTGFPPGTFTGVEHAGDAVAATAKADLLAAYTDASTRLSANAIAGDISGLTITPGLYSNSSSIMVGVGSNVTFDAKGDPGAIFIIQMGSTLTTGVGSTMTLIGGAQPNNIFWSVGSSATLGVNSTTVGTVLASASITAQTGAALNGRFLTNIAAVTLDSNNVAVPPRSRAKARSPKDRPRSRKG